MRLWEAKHAYYCNEGNYFARGTDTISSHRSWKEFLDAEGDSDMDYNLVFRFDFAPPRDESAEPDKNLNYPIKWQGDENYRDCTLKLFYMGQRKGLYRCVLVEVCRADEPAIREWLQPRFDYLKALWSPLA